MDRRSRCFLFQRSKRCEQMTSRRLPLFYRVRHVLKTRWGPRWPCMCAGLTLCVISIVFLLLHSDRRAVSAALSTAVANQRARRVSVRVDGYAVPAACHARPHLDAAGTLADGAPPGHEFRVVDPGACCEACAAAVPRCNVWVWNTNTSECWLKRVDRFPERPVVYGSGPAAPPSPWMSGSMWEVPKHVPVSASPTRTCVHTVVTSNGTPYMNWQTLLVHASWMRVANKGNSALRAFTRVLHAERHDELSKTIHTEVSLPGGLKPPHRPTDAYLHPRCSNQSSLTTSFRWPSALSRCCSGCTRKTRASAATCLWRRRIMCS